MAHNQVFLYQQSGSNSAILGMRNNAPGGGGNDLAIDNITFRACSSTIEVSGTVPFARVQVLKLIPELKTCQAAHQFFNGKYLKVEAGLILLGKQIPSLHFRALMTVHW